MRQLGELITQIIVLIKGVSLSLYSRSLQCINRDLSEEFYTLSSFPDSLYKKVTLLKYFHSYMTEHLLKAGGTAGECTCHLAESGFL